MGTDAAELRVGLDHGAQLGLRRRLVVAGSVVVSDDALRRWTTRFGVRARGDLESADHARYLPRRPAHPARLGVQATVRDRLEGGDFDPRHELFERGRVRAVRVERPRLQPPDADLESACDVIKRSSDRPTFVGCPVPVIGLDSV